MIVDRDSLSVFPISDKVLKTASGKIVNEISRDSFAWSNELVLHVIEIKTNGPASRLELLGSEFQKEVTAIAKILEDENAILVPAAMHPWMDPYTEMKIWPHEYNPIYEAYNRIFDCRGHGWANLQSTHFNLPFSNDHEFEKLHAACRIVLPLIPALAASSPVADSEIKPFLDYRMEVYRTNSIKIPSVTGLIVPETVFSEKEYREQIFEKMYRDIAPFDPEGILQDEWLNSRGAMTRFDRKAIELRVIDIQEAPIADIAILSLIVAVIRFLVDEKLSSLQEQKEWSELELYKILMDVIKEGDRARIQNRRFLSLFGFWEAEIQADRFWSDLFERIHRVEPFPDEVRNPLKIIFNDGPLARRILNSLAGTASRRNLENTCRELSYCLHHGCQFVP